MRSTRRGILSGAAVSLLAGKAGATTADLSDVVVEAMYGGRDDSWRLSLFADHSARLHVEMNKMPIGSIVGQFRFYDNDVADVRQLATFGRLGVSISAPQPDIHPWVYEIALLLPDSGRLRRVRVSMGRSMPVTDELREFFAIWRNIWSGIPGSPKMPASFART